MTPQTLLLLAYSPSDLCDQLELRRAAGWQHLASGSLRPGLLFLLVSRPA